MPSWLPTTITTDRKYPTDAIYILVKLWYNNIAHQRGELWQKVGVTVGSEDWFRAHLSDAISRVKSGAAASGITMLDYANGRVLFEHDMTETALGHYGPGGRIDVALVEINKALESLEDHSLDGLMIALRPDSFEGQKVLILTHA